MNNKFILEEQKNTPQISFDPEKHEFRITGRSFPENSKKFYSKVLEWFNDYSPSPGSNMNFHFSFYYISSSSIISLMELIKKINSYNAEGFPVNIFWYYDEDDDDIKKIGEDYANFCNGPFHLISNG